VDVPAQRAVLLLVERGTGKVLDHYRPAGV